MARVGVDENTGRLLMGWDHCKQSMRKILFTALNERVQRRKFGSKLPDLIDKPQNEEFVLDIYEATATALEPRIVEGQQYGEPGFVLLRTNLDASVPATVTMKLSGVYFEHGHLGDYSNPSEQKVSFVVTETSAGISVVPA
jgi:hypothetical protein